MQDYDKNDYANLPPIYNEMPVPKQQTRQLSYTAPADAGQRSWDKKQRYEPLMDEYQMTHRTQPGYRRKIRRERNGQAYQGRADLLTSDGVPEDVMNLFRDVFAYQLDDKTEDGREKLRLVMLPHINRIGIVELHLDPTHGENWRTIWYAQHMPVEGKLPSDYEGNLELAHHTGRMGEFKLPDREEFEHVERCDRKRYGVDAVEEFIHSFEARDAYLSEFKMRDFERAFCDYYFNQEVDDMNQLFGSGQRMRSVATIMLKSDPARWKRVQHEGWVEVTKRKAGEYQAEKREALGVELAKWNELRGLSRNWEPSEELLEATQANLAPHDLSLMDLIVFARMEQLKTRIPQAGAVTRSDAAKEQHEIDKLETQLDEKELARAERKRQLRTVYQGIEATARVRTGKGRSRTLTKKEVASMMKAKLKRGEL